MKRKTRTKWWMLILIIVPCFLLVGFVGLLFIRESHRGEWSGPYQQTTLTELRQPGLGSSTYKVEVTGYLRLISKPSQVVIDPPILLGEVDLRPLGDKRYTCELPPVMAEGAWFELTDDPSTKPTGAYPHWIEAGLQIPKKTGSIAIFVAPLPRGVKPGWRVVKGHWQRSWWPGGRILRIDTRYINFPSR